MTVTYSPRELLVFSHLKGTVLPEVWRMCAFTCALAYALCHIYNPIRRTVRDGGPKTILYYIFHDCDAFFGLCTSFVTFILSFFNATIFGRWWKMRELCGTVNGRTVDTCVLLSAYIKDQEQLDEMLRLLWLAHALHVHSVIPSSHAGLLAQLVEGGLLMPGEELAALQQCSSLASSTPISIAYGWFSSRFGEALLALPPSLHSGLLMSVQTNVSAMRASAADVLMYLATPVPLAYTHLLEMMVVMYVLMAPIGLVPRLLWMAVPGCFVTTLIFYGFMCVGKLMLNPFDQKMADAFEVNAFLKGTRFACLEVSSAVFPARLGEEGLRFRNDKPADTAATAAAGKGCKVANGSAHRVDSGRSDSGEGSPRDLVPALRPSQIPPSGSEDGLRRRRQSPHDSPLLSAALGLGGSMEELARFPLPMDGHMPGFKDS